MQAWCVRREWANEKSPAGRVRYCERALGSFCENSPSPTSRMRSSGLKGMVGGGGAACKAALLVAGAGFTVGLECRGTHLDDSLWVFDRFVFGIVHAHWWLEAAVP